MTTITGGPDLKGPPRDGPRGIATFGSPGGIAATEDGTLFVADIGNHVVVRIAPNGNAVRIAGSGRQGVLDGPALDAEFYGPTDVAVAKDGTVYVADGYGHRIRKIGTDGMVSTLVGGGSPGLATGSFRDGLGTDARFDGVAQLKIDLNGDLVVADYNNHRLRKVTPQGQVTTIAGTGQDGSEDGPSTLATFSFPSAIALGPDGSIWVTEHGNNDIRRIAPGGQVTTALKSAAPYAPGSAVSYPSGIAVTRSGEVYVSDTQGFRLLRLNSNGTVTSIVGSGKPGFADGVGANASVAMPTGMASLASGGIVFVDTLNSAVRLLEVK